MKNNTSKLIKTFSVLVVIGFIIIGFVCGLYDLAATSGSSDSMQAAGIFAAIADILKWLFIAFGSYALLRGFAEIVEHFERLNIKDREEENPENK